MAESPLTLVDEAVGSPIRVVLISRIIWLAWDDLRTTMDLASFLQDHS